MKINPLRKILHKIGLDVRRFRTEPNRLGWLNELGIKTVIDIGANTGQFVDEIREVLPECFVYSFEPLRDCYEKLLENRKGDDRFKGFNFALGNENGRSIIKRSASSGSSSLLRMAALHEQLYPHTKGQTDEEITIKRLDDLKEISLDNLTKNILVKIDVQGFEDKVIAGGIDFLKRTRVMIVESSFVTLYEGQPLFANIYKMLTDLGFSYAGAIHQKPHKKNGRILFEDAIFVRVDHAPSGAISNS